MRKLHILQLGTGNVGSNLIEQIIVQQRRLKKELGIELKYCGLFNSKGGEFKKSGFCAEEIKDIIVRLDNRKIRDNRKKINQAIAAISSPHILLDLTASDNTIPLLKLALKSGGYVVLANKKPLAGKLRDFKNLHKIGGHRLFYEAVAGAGLPVVQTLKNLIATGDEIIEIKGCFSGTLGFIFSQLDEGKLFSEIVLEAKRDGFTEPDPRDDLSGLDVARKAIILSRLVGHKTELTDIVLTGLCPKNMQKLSLSEFLERVKDFNAFYKERVKQAKSQNKVLRYVAKINSSECSVGLQEIDVLSDIGSLKGPDNLIVFKTKRYFNNPLIIKGPGAGGEVTAAGVFTDILSAARIIKGGFYE